MRNNRRTIPNGTECAYRLMIHVSQMGKPTGDSLKCHKCVVNRLLLQYLGEAHPNVTDCSQAAKRLSERGFMPKIGYARVSSSSQDLDIQNAKLVAAGCEVIRSETASGASRDDRSELATVMEFLRDGDELVVHRLDRIGRSNRDVLNLVHELDARGASLRVLEPAVTTAGDMGHIVITVLGMVADMELKFIHDRQRAGIEAAKGKGVYKGRQKSVDDEEIRRLAAAGIAKAKIARDLGVSRMTVYRALADNMT